MRSRVLGNNLMLARVTGALSVLAIGLLADAHGFVVAMMSAALFVAIALPLAFRKKGLLAVLRDENLKK